MADFQAAKIVARIAARAAGPDLDEQIPPATVQLLPRPRLNHGTEGWAGNTKAAAFEFRNELTDLIVRSKSASLKSQNSGSNRHF